MENATVESVLEYTPKLTEENLENLARLATKLESLPKKYKHFEMSDFLEIDDSDDFTEDTIGNRVRQYARQNGGVDAIGMDLKCGTVACAVGHGPSAGILLNDDELTDEDSVFAVDWHKYTLRFIAEDARACYGGRTVGSIQPMFDWMFGAYWASEDNTPWGAAARIRYVLDKGQPPEEFLRYDIYNPGMYADYIIRRARPLPVDFYTPTMLAAITGSSAPNKTNV